MHRDAIQRGVEISLPAIAGLLEGRIAQADNAAFLLGLAGFLAAAVGGVVLDPGELP